MQGNILIQSGGKSTSDATSVASDILNGKIAYTKSGRTIGSMPNQGNKVITPTNSIQEFSSGYYSGVTINPKSTVDINGLIEQYKVELDNNVNAGDFVNFINRVGDFTIGENTLIVSTNNASKGMSAIEISQNKVLILYVLNYSLYGMICTISGTTITAGTAVQIVSGTSSTSVATKSSKIVKLSANKYFILYAYPSALFGVIITISGNTIATGIGTILANYSNSANGRLSAIALTENKVFIAGSYGSNYYLYGMICTISGTTITAGTYTELYSLRNASYQKEIIKLTDNKLFITHSGGTSTTDYYLYATICNINDTTITVLSRTQLSSIQYSGYSISAVKLSDDKIVIAHSYTTSYHLYGMICKINDSIVSNGVDTQLSTVNFTGEVISSFLLMKNKIFIVHSYNSNRYIYGTVVSITQDLIYIEKSQYLLNTSNTGRYISTCLINNDILVLHNYNNSNYWLTGFIVNVDTQISCKKIENSEEEINGIAKTSGISEQTIDVYVPNI